MIRLELGNSGERTYRELETRERMLEQPEWIK